MVEKCLELVILEPQNLETNETAQESHIEKLSRLKRIWYNKRNRKTYLKEAYETSKKSYDRNTSNIEFSEGESVWKRIFTQSDASKKYTARFAPRYMFCKFIRKIGSSSYELEDEHGKNVGIWNAVNLK